MKCACASTVLLSLVSTIAVVSPAFSQTPETFPVANAQTQSALLVTQPAAIDEPASMERVRSPWDANRLNNIANSIQAYPGAKGSDILSKDLFHAPSRVLSDDHPLEVFQPPAPNQSFGINLNRL